LQKIAVVDNPTLLRGSRQEEPLREEEPLRMSACTLYFQKLESLVYIFVADSMGISSFKFLQSASKDASFLHQSAKVDDFGTNRKRVYDFLLVGHCDYGPILHHFWDTATYWLKIAYFSYPFLIMCPRSLPVFLLEFRGEANRQEIESWA